MKTTSMDSVQKDQAVVSITEFMRYETDKKAHDKHVSRILKWHMTRWITN